MAKKCSGKYAWIALVKMPGQPAKALYRDGRRALFRTQGDAAATAIAVGGAHAAGYDARRVCVGRDARFE